MSKGKNIFNQWRDLLFGTKSHELLVFCFFLAVSSGFWLLQALNETLEREVQVRLELENIPDNVVIIDSLPPTLSVVLRDRGLILARHSIYSLFQPNRLKLDFARYDTKRKDAEVYVPATDIVRMLNRVFDASTKITSFRPDTIRYAYNHGGSRKFPVRLAGTFETSRENYIKSISIEPESVLVFAPKVILDTMHAVYSEPFLLEELHKDGSHPISLRKQKLLKYEQEQVNIKVDLGFYTEKTVEVPVMGLNFPAEKKLRTFPARVAITFRVESGRYQQVKPEDFVLATTYEELLSNTEDSKLHLHLKTVPEGVSDVRILPPDVDYLIEQMVPEQN